MASSTETGHAVNISNFKLLIDKDNAFGVTYNPSNTDIVTANMIALWTTADTAHATLVSIVATAKQPINAREILFEPLNKLVTKSLASLDSTKASKQVKKDARGLADKIRGFKLQKNTPETDPDFVSRSHQGFVQRADNFKLYNDLLATVPEYLPNEADIKLPALILLQSKMKLANDNIGTIIAPIGTARATRDHALYDEETGILDVAQKSKKYVKSVFGATAAEYKLVSGIKFRRPAK